MATMHTPHPGEILREWLGDMSVTDAAQHLGVARASLSRVLNGSAGISADMALRLQAALIKLLAIWLGEQTTLAKSLVMGASPEMWVVLQDDYWSDN